MKNTETLTSFIEFNKAYNSIQKEMVEKTLAVFDEIFKNRTWIPISKSLPDNWKILNKDVCMSFIANHGYGSAGIDCIGANKPIVGIQGYHIHMNNQVFLSEISLILDNGQKACIYKDDGNKVLIVDNYDTLIDAGRLAVLSMQKYF